MRISTTRGRAAALGLAAVAAVGGGVAVAVPAGATSTAAGTSTAGKTSAPAQAQQARPAHLPSAVTAASGQLRTMASLDGRCQVGDVCLYYYDSAGAYGSRYDTAHNDADLSNNRFLSAGAGRRSIVTNNAEAVWNRDPNTSVVVCTGVGYSETCGAVGPGVLGDFTDTYRNNVESFVWDDAAN